MNDPVVVINYRDVIGAYTLVALIVIAAIFFFVYWIVSVFRDAKQARQEKRIREYQKFIKSLELKKRAKL